MAHGGAAAGASAAVTGSGAGGGGVAGIDASGSGAGGGEADPAHSIGEGTGPATGEATGCGAATAGAWGASMADRPEPQPAQNRCSAAIRGVPQLGQNPNPVVISSLPLASRSSELAEVRSGSGGGVRPSDAA